MSSVEPPVDPDLDAGERPQRDAAVAAERETGRREGSTDEAKRNVALRIATIVGGFLLVGVGVAAIPLPGPGWLIVFVGLTLLAQEFTWAERWVDAVRKRAKIDELREKSIWVQVGVAALGLVLMGGGIYWSVRRYL